MCLRVLSALLNDQRSENALKLPSFDKRKRHRAVKKFFDADHLV